MDKIKKKDIMRKSEAELGKLLSEYEIEKREVRFATSGSKGKDVKAERNLKKTIARMKTILNKNGK